MKFRIHIIRSILLVLLFLNFCESFAETTRDHAILIKTNFSNKPTYRVQLSWERDSLAENYLVFSKDKNSASWTKLAQQKNDSPYYTDSTIISGIAKEYFVQKIDTNYSGYGYIYAGEYIPEVKYRGSLLLIVDETISDRLTAKLNRYILDLIGDGWDVFRYNAPRTEKFNPYAVSKIKKLINSEYNKSGENLRSVILFGRIAVPYSGTYAFDGHFPIHYGAWASDVYYGVMSDKWTDETTNTTTAERPENRNIPFDGKFDQTNIQEDCKLEIGRIDFYNLPNFKEKEIELYERYLDKNHSFRHNALKISQKAMIDDGFGMYASNAFASTAWMNFSALVGEDSIETGNYVPKLTNNSYIWSYGCNQGSYNSMLLTLYTDQLAKNNINGVFTYYLGSYLGDFDSEDNLMRAALASNPSILCSFWGLPYWFLHHMALGENIGYQAKLTQNNNFLYQTSNSDGLRGIHIALMGDPTLRMHYFDPPKDFKLVNTVQYNSENNIVSFGWNYSDLNAKFHIFRSDSLFGRYTLLSKEAFSQKEFSDTVLSKKQYFYMVRALKLHYSTTGSYYNLSQGSFADSKGLLSSENHESDIIKVYPNPAFDNLNIEIPLNLSVNKLEIRNETGQLINEFTINNQSNIINWDLKSVTGIPVYSGVYLILIKTDTQIIRQMITVIR